jgi:HEAT repeat protein
MKSNPSVQNREGIRLRVLWPIAALMAVVLIAAILAKSHSGNPPKSPAQATVAVTASNVTATPRETSARPPRIPHVSQPQSMTEPETDRLAALLLDKNAPLQVRRQSARSLAHIGTEQALATLKSGLISDLPPYVKAAIAESLGQVSSPEATALLHELVNGKDETVARGAARGLASRGDADAANTLGTLLFNDQTPLSVRTESALALGDVNLPAAQDYLTRAISQIHDDDVLESALDGMGRRPFSETEEFFRNYLNSPTVPTEAKVLAIEAVRDADGEITPFLSNYANDANPDIRNAAKEALDFLKPIPSKPTTGK